MTPPTLRAIGEAPVLRAIKCSERMPTSEDADTIGRVLFMDAADGYMAHVFAHDPPKWATHFFPLNRSAIATDAEEQRGEGGE